jgi:hypothetical protein
MQDFLSKMVGQELDVFCGGVSSLHGEVVQVEGGVLHLKDAEGTLCYVAIEKIIAVWERREDSNTRAGFLGGVLK